MQFFEHQDQARGRTSLLVVLFMGAVLALGAISASVAHFGLTLDKLPHEPLGENHWSHVALAAVVTLGTIFLGSAYRLLQLRGGGVKVAETLGGTLASAGSADPLEGRVINVVEEMAIASGLVVPPVYIMRRESGINAFAAGWSPDDAVIGVTQGALEALDRDQLQGVIAHEFSHILNRDCALNMRLMGVLHGIVLISIIGRIMIQFGSGSGRSRGRNDGQAHLMIAGAAIWLFGSLGVLIARLIQSAVSRQREYLADASAVQFTRNPSGIGGALATIGSQSSALSTPRGSESSHMLIGEPGSSNFLSSLASHPPLFERIQRVLQSWDGDFQAIATPPGSVRKAIEKTNPSEQLGNAQAQKEQSDEALAQEILLGGGAPGAISSQAGIGLGGGVGSAVLGGAILEGALSPGSAPSVGSDLQEPASTAPLSRAQALLKSIPQELRTAAEEAFSARALIVAWVLDSKQQERAAQMALLGGDHALCMETTRLQPQLSALDPLARLPLFDIAAGSMALLSEAQKDEFSERLESLRAQLSEKSYHAYCLSTLALRHLRPPQAPKKSKKLLIKDAIETVLGVLAVEGHDRPEQAKEAFLSGTERLTKRNAKLDLPAGHTLTVQRLEASLNTLLRLPTKTRAELLDAAESIASHDGLIRPSEAELLRVMAACLGVAIAPAFAS